VLNAALMAIRRRRPHGRQIHSDQGTQYGSDAWRRFCRSNPELSMSRKGNCWDNAVTDSFFRSLNNELSGSTAGQRRTVRELRCDSTLRGTVVVVQHAAQSLPPTHRILDL
jgi:transposase InsO family protein